MALEELCLLTRSTFVKQGMRQVISLNKNYKTTQESNGFICSDFCKEHLGCLGLLDN